MNWKTLIAVLITSLVLISSTSTYAVNKRRILSSSHFCDQEKKVCLRGQIEFEKNTKIMEISARILRARGEGRVFFDFVGLTPINENVFHTLSMEIEGRSSEIINFRAGMPFSNRTEWRLLEVRFIPENSH